jgi:hypothetical protein
MTPESKEEIRRLLDGGDNGTIIESERKSWWVNFLLDKGSPFVHIVNGCQIYPYNSWIYKVNETFSSSANSNEMAGPLSAPLPSNLVSRSV